MCRILRALTPAIVGVALFSTMGSGCLETAEGGGSSGGGGDRHKATAIIQYGDCAEAREFEDHLPLKVGEDAGYASWLDDDGDGLACERGEGK